MNKLKVKQLLFLLICSPNIINTYKRSDILLYNTIFSDFYIYIYKCTSNVSNGLFLRYYYITSALII